jgi:hypothetical protein
MGKFSDTLESCVTWGKKRKQVSKRIGNQVGRLLSAISGVIRMMLRSPLSPHLKDVREEPAVQRIVSETGKGPWGSMSGRTWGAEGTTERQRSDRRLAQQE